MHAICSFPSLHLVTVMSKTRLLLTSALCALALALPASETEAQTFFSTTSGAAGSIDPNWTVAANVLGGQYNAGFGGFGGTFGSAYRWTINYDDWFGPRPGTVTPPLISNNAAATNGGNTYFTFRQSFDLTGFDPNTAVLTFRWACDDTNEYTGAVGWTPQFALNGGPLQGAGTCGPYSLGSSVSLSSGFVSGMNVLDFYVQGNGLFDGFGLETESFTAARTTSVPEPTSFALLGAGVMAMGAAARRRAQRP